MKRIFIRDYKIVMIKTWYESITKIESFTAQQGKNELKVKYPTALIYHIPRNRKIKF